MAIGIDDLYDDDYESTQEEQQINNQEPTTTNQQQQVLDNNSSDDDFISEYLKSKGIDDPSKIMFEDDNNQLIERSWNDLSKEEQINILAGNEPTDDTQLSDDEIDLLNAIRSSGMDVNSYMRTLLQPSQPQHKQYKIDELSDDDLYVLDILEKVGGDNISDDELTEALEAAKKNEKLFQKTVEGLRTQYIQLEKDQEIREANERAARQQEQYNSFASSIMNEIRGLNTFAGQDLELSNEDIEELSSFMLHLDENGMSPFGKAMQDPALFTRAAFWLLNEDKIIEELTKQMQDTYTRGYENAKKENTNFSWLDIPSQSYIQEVYSLAYEFRLKVQKCIGSLTSEKATVFVMLPAFSYIFSSFASVLTA